MCYVNAGSVRFRPRVMFGQVAEPLACLSAACDELRDLLAALLADLLEVLVAVLLGDRVAADLADAAVEARAVELLDLLPALLADLLVEVGAVALSCRPATLLPDLLVELRSVPLCGGRTPATACLRDGHGAFVLGHDTSPLLALMPTLSR